MKVSIVSKERYACAEGPYWDEAEQKLWHVDVHGKKLCRLNPQTQETEHKSLGGYATLIVPYSSDPNRVLFSETKQLLSMSWSGEDKHVLSEIDVPDVRLNDGKCDALGRLWTGTMGIEGSPSYLGLDPGSMYSMEENKTEVKRHLSGIGISNGLGWSKDNRIMYFIDSLARNVVAFDFDLQLGELGKRRVVYDFADEEGFPDGMCTDAEDKIWVACFNGSKVVRIDPEIGVPTETIKFPATQMTSCCFGGPNYETLFVTSAYVGKENRNENDGAVFQITGLGVKGLPPNAFGKGAST